MEVKLVLTTDIFPFETSVSLEDTASGESYWTDEFFRKADTEYTLQQKVFPTGCYNFVITDVTGDGICCYAGSGSFNLFFDGFLVFTSDGDFGFSTSYFVGDGCADKI